MKVFEIGVRIRDDHGEFQSGVIWMKTDREVTICGRDALYVKEIEVNEDAFGIDLEVR